MLWRRHHAQAEAAGEAEGRQEADAPVRQGGNSAVGVPGGAEDGRLRRGTANFGATEGWPSGLRRTLGKRVCVKAYRGFESHSLRQDNCPQAPSGSDGDLWM